MKDSATEPKSTTQSDAPSSIANSAGPTVVRISPERNTAESAFNNAGGEVNKTVAKDGTGRPIIKMKRTGFSTIPPTLPKGDGSVAGTPTAPVSHRKDKNPEPASVVGDIMPPATAPTPSPNSELRPGDAKSSGSAKKPKYETEEERRKAISLSLKQRWASGTMAHVHQKRTETLRRRKEAEALSSTPTASGSRKRPFYLSALNSETPESPTRTHRHVSGVDMGEDHPTCRRSMNGQAGPISNPSSATRRRTSDIGDEGDENFSGTSTTSSFSAVSDEEMGGMADHVDGATSTETPIEMAAPDRPYTQFRDVDGVLKPTNGALIPEGYQRNTSSQTHPWICPIRSCRKMFIAMVYLGAHFSTAHRGALLHDNDDGTFTQRGHASSVYREPVVVSRGPADPSDPPPVAPSYPVPPKEPSGDREEFWRFLQPFLMKHKGPTIPTASWIPVLLDLPRVREPDWNLGWLEFHPFADSHVRDVAAIILQLTGEPAPVPCRRCSEGRGPFRSCIVIPPEADSRALQVITCCANCYYHCNSTYCSHRSWAVERSKRILQERLAEYLRRRHLENTGDGIDISEEGDSQQEQNASDYEESRSETLSGNFPMTGSGRPSATQPSDGGGLDNTLFGALLPAGYKLDTTIPGRPWVCPVRTCRRAHCKRTDLGFHFQRVHYGALLNDNGDGTFTIKGSYGSKSSGLGKGGKVLTPAPPIVVSHDPILSGSPVPPAQLPPYLVGSRTPAALTEPTQPTQTTQPQTGESDIPGVVPSLRRQTRSQTATSSALLSKGESAGQDDLLEMEDWEVAPGRIRESADGDGENIAFSKPYLSSAQAIPVCEDVAVRVDTIPPGGTLKLEAETDKMRLCSVAAGKVRVTIGREPEFVVGPHGLFKVKVGVACTVRNGLHLDAVVHTTILEGYA